MKDKKPDLRVYSQVYSSKFAKVRPFVLSLSLMLLLAIVISHFKEPLGLVNISMIFLLPVLISAAKWGTWPSLVVAGAGVIIFDLFFVPPTLSFTVSDIRYLVTFLIFFVVALITGTLSTRLRQQIQYSREREARVTALYALSRDIAAVSELDSVLESVVRKVADTVEGHAAIILPDSSGKLELPAVTYPSDADFTNRLEGNVAGWVFRYGKTAGRGTETMKDALGLYLPLLAEQEVQGILAITLKDIRNYLQPEHLQMLEAFAGLTALAINRIKLTEKAREAQTLTESEKLRTALFNSLSHDLRTPLASIIGAVTSLLEGENVYTPAARHDLLHTIQMGANRMNRFVSNLLDMARLESGMLKLNKEWCDIQDVVGVALSRLRESLRDRPLKICIKNDLPLILADCILIEQVIVNLLDNALKYSEAGSEISISARQVKAWIEVSVAEKGAEIPEEDLGRIFDKFYRLKSPRRVSGTGLGLSICKGIVEAHGGNIRAANEPDVGVAVTFALPISEQPPGAIFTQDGGQRYGE